MIMNIPCKSNPMPYYVGHYEPDYTTMPFTIQTMSGGGNVKLTMRNGSADSSASWYYKKNDAKSWSSYTFNSDIVLNDENDTVSFSGTNSSFSTGWGSRIYTVSGSVPIKIFGRIDSLANGSGGIYDHFLWGNYAVVNMRNLVLPDRTTYTNGQFDGFCYSNSTLTGGLIFRNPGNTSCYKYFFNGCSKLKVFEIAFTSWVDGAWDGSSFSNANNANCYCIKPSELSINKSINALSSFNFINREADGLYRCDKTTNTSYGNKINQTLLLEQGVVQDE